MSMRNVVVRLVSTLVLAAALGGPARAAEDPAVKVAKGGKGEYLTDAKGMTLYVFKKDSPGKSACTAQCVANWPLFFREKVAVSGNLKAADFATITREDGQKQTTYKGMPLYYFVQDKSPGETKGDGAKEVWFLVKP
jgi:predicted lipoprotein with Yx(FWY)xxD motif